MFTKHLNECISSAGFLKVLIQDKKNLVKSGELKPCKEPIGLACLQGQYMFAHDYYEVLGNHFFEMAKSGQTGILPAVKECFAIAGKNLKTIIDATPDADRKRELLGKFNKTVGFAEEIAKKI